MSDTAVLSMGERNFGSTHFLPDSHLAHLSDRNSVWSSMENSSHQNNGFAGRRPLPHSFTLPLPQDIMSGHDRFPSYAPGSQSQPALPNGPTPSNGLSNDVSPLSSGTSNASANGPGPYTASGYWPTPGNHAQNFQQYSQGPSPSTTYAQGPYPPSNQFSPVSRILPNGGRGSPEAPSYEVGSGAYALGPIRSGGGQGQNPSSSTSQHMSNTLPSSQAPSQGSMGAPDSFGRLPSTQSFYNHTPASTPLQPSFPAFSQHSPQQSPNTSGPPQHRISPISAHSMHPSQGGFPPRMSYSSGYNLPAMPGPGPTMSNVHNPNSQMVMLNGSVQMGYQQPGGGHLYPHQGQQQTHDRPFKCDQCQQSFNRNHDLKRHKRIHLAVKPFPCDCCDKSFSRKDALKRHRLVKGCGNAKERSGNTTNANAGPSTQSSPGNSQSDGEGRPTREQEPASH